MQLSIYKLKIPFNFSFSHAKANRNKTQTIIVKASDKLGLIGLGEGCPREYVTGETVRSSINFFDNNKDAFKQLTSLVKLKKWLFLNKTKINSNPSAWCAVECAILDLLAKKNKQSIEAYLGISSKMNSFVFSAVIGAENINTFYQIMTHYKKIGFTHYKIKISGDANLDKKKINYIKSLGINDIRLDGNNIWHNYTEAVDYIKHLDHQFSALEEPVSAFDFATMQKISKVLNLPIILDESFLQVDDFSNLKNNCFIINIRISKMGGILRSLTIANKAKKRKIKIIIGSQVGETSILSRAALVVARQNLVNLTAQEGAFGNYLLKYDITNNSITFGKDGKLILDNTNNDGFGINYNLKLLV